jgi:hypothetical protein
MQSIASIWNARYENKYSLKITVNIIIYLIIYSFSTYAEYYISFKTIKEIITSYEFDVIYIGSIRKLAMFGKTIVLNSDNSYH